MSFTALDGEICHRVNRNAARWTTTDINWSLGIFGTAIGAGILFLPINAGIGGIWPLILLTVILSPLTYITHRGILRFCLAAKNPTADFNEAANEHLGKRAGIWMTFAYFAFILPIVMAYSIGLTNTVDNLLRNQLHWAVPDRWLLSLLLMAVLIFVVNCGEKIILKSIATLVYPLAAILLGISLYLIPQWSTAPFSYGVSFPEMTKGFLSTLPILVFALAYIPICSALAQSYRKQFSNKDELHVRTERIIGAGTGLLMLVILFFTFSCILALPPEALAQAKADNISVMTLFAQQSEGLWFSILTTVVALTAICSSFIGYYLGAREGLFGIIKDTCIRNNKPLPSNNKLKIFINGLFLVVLWLVGYLNWGVIDIMGAVAAPLMAVILYLMPVYAARKTPALKKYRSRIDWLTASIGLICIGSYIIATAL